MLAAPVSIWALGALDVDALSFERFLLFKAAYAAALGAVVTPIIALWAIAEGESAGQPG